MPFNIGAVNYTVTAFLFAILSVLLLTVWRGRLHGLLFFLVCFFTAIWASIAAYSAQFGYSSSFNVIASELIKNAVTAVFLVQLFRSSNHEHNKQILKFVARAAIILPFILLVLIVYLKYVQAAPSWLGFDLRVLCHILIALFGLSLLEQIFRSIKSEQLWALKFLCFGFGALYAFDFLLYSDALLFKRINIDLWDARGIVDALALCLIAIAVHRNPKTDSLVSISRSAIFYTTALVAAGVYLIIMSAGGFYLKSFGGDWGAVVAYAFLFTAVLLLIILVFSGSIRARIRVFIDKHFLDYKYDYRAQWLGLIRDLSTENAALSLESRALNALTEMMDSPGGSLWVMRNQRLYSPVAISGMSELEKETEERDGLLVKFLEKWQWVINLDEYKSEPDLYRELTLPDWLESSPKAWLIVPLMLQAELYGFVVIVRPRAERDFNWEDIDLLKTAGRQVAVHLAQDRSALALIEARQFEAFNRFSAYVVHDLKNLVSQLALVVKNAEKHKHNPAFMDDAILTVDNAVERMNRLLAQLRAGVVTDKFNESVDLAKAIAAVVREKRNTRPVPVAKLKQKHVFVVANEARLVSVIGHLVQNAQDATADSGELVISLYTQSGNAILAIRDSGEGMDADFIKNRLFEPFVTTKGLTGMGIGAHESRAYIEELGGTLEVESEKGVGSTFFITLPLSEKKESGSEL